MLSDGIYEDYGIVSAKQFNSSNYAPNDTTYYFDMVSNYGDSNIFYGTLFGVQEFVPNEGTSYNIPYTDVQTPVAYNPYIAFADNNSTSSLYFTYGNPVKDSTPSGGLTFKQKFNFNQFYTFFKPESNTASIDS